MAHYPRICVSSTGGGGGKTLLSLGIARALSQSGIMVKPFKKGPDYIDAAWLSHASGVPATNLDPFFLDAGALRNQFLTAICQTAHTARLKNKPPLALIEGNRGLYDGLDESGSCSTAHLARIIQAPILLCVNSVKTTRTMAAIIKGLQSFEEGLNFCGVVLNRTGSLRHESSLRKAIENYTDIPVLGALPRLKKNPLPEKHMGLACAGNSRGESAESALGFLGRYISDNCDLHAILQASRAAPEIIEPPALRATLYGPAPTKITPAPRIGYVLDEALWFYYPENLAALNDAGCHTVKLSLLDEGNENRAAWEHLDGLYLGGGFPEDYPGTLAASPYLHKIKNLANSGMPIYAECGGLIILCKSLKREGRSWPMCGLFPHEIVWHNRPRGLGYVEGVIIRENIFYPSGQKLRGHEFHYSSCEFAGQLPSFGMRLGRGNGLHIGEGGIGLDGLIHKNVWASYMHIFAPAVPCWAENFALAAKRYSRDRQQAS